MRDHVRLALSGDLSLARASRRVRGRGVAAAVLARRPRGGVLWWLPVACAAVYAVAALVDFHELITSVYVNSDAALAPVLGQAAAGIPAGSYVSLGNHAWYEEWLLLLASRGLPARRQLWELAPMLWSVAGLAALVWSTRRAMDAWSAALCAAALVCVGAFGRFCFLAINWHSLTVVHTVAISAALVWLVPRLGSISWPRLTAAGMTLGLLSALPTASDSLFPFWALIPLAGTTAVLVRGATPRIRGRLLAFTTLTFVVAVAGALVIADAMRHAGVTSRALPVALVAGGIGHNLELLAESYAYLAGGRIVAPSLHLQSLLATATAALVLVALLLVLDQVRRIAAGRWPPPGITDVQLAYVAFWAMSLIATSLVFLLTDAPKDALAGRYLLAGYTAIAALLPLVAARGVRMRTLVTAGVCAFAAIAAFQLIRRPFVVITSPEVSVRFPGPATAAALVRFARQEGVSRGYAGYWDAEQLTWGTRFSVLVRPVRVCSARSHSLCYPQLGMISSWYTPQPNARSLLVVDSLGTSYNGVLARDPALGRPLASRRLGYITVYVYSYDIAARLARPRCNFSWAHPC